MDTNLFIIIILGYSLLFFIFMYAVLYVIIRHFKNIIPPLNNIRVHPNNTIIQLQEIHRQMNVSSRYIRERNSVIEELKNKIIVINPDDSFSLGIEN